MKVVNKMCLVALQRKQNFAAEQHEMYYNKQISIKKSIYWIDFKSLASDYKTTKLAD